MTERHGHRLPLLAVAVVAFALFVVPLARREVLTFRDHTDYFVPLRFFTATHLRVLRLPLWNPYNASGEPWMANPQTAVFYPPAWIFLVLPFPAAYVAFLAFHIALLGAGAYLLFARSASRGAALFGAIALMLCGPVLSMLDTGDNLASFAWLPWVMFFAAGADGLQPVATQRTAPATRVGVARGFSPSAPAATLALCFLAGEPFIAAVAAIIYVLIVRRPRDIAKTALLTVSLSAIQLLPFLELLHGSDRQGGFAGRDILRDSMPLLEWWRVAVPARADAAGYDAALSQHFIPIVYIGVITTALAIAGVIVAIGMRSAAAAAWIALLATSIGIASGPSLLTRLPLTVLRYPARMVPFGALAIVALAVIGWERIRNRRWWLDAALILVVAVDLIAAAIPLLRSGPMPHVPYGRSFGAQAKIVRIDEFAAIARGASREAWIAGYLNLLDRRFDAWTAAPLTSRAYAELYSRALRDRRVLRRLGAGYVLSSNALAGEGIVPLVRTDGVYATALSDALPLARVELGDGTVVPARSVALDSSHVRVTIDTPSDGLLILTQRAAPGWRVRVDGVSQRDEISDGVFRAVRLRRGAHQIDWTFAPWSLVLGAIATIAAIICMIFFRTRVR